MPPLKMPDLTAVTEALNKLTSAITDDVNDFVTRSVPAVDAKREALFGPAGKVQKALESRNAALGALDKGLDQLDAALSNGDPTQGTSAA